MKNYELMNLLGKAEANEDIKISVCLSIKELMAGESIDQETFSLCLDVSDVDAENGVIDTMI